MGEGCGIGKAATRSADIGIGRELSFSGERMTIFIPDDILKRAGITEQEARVELACGLFDSGRLELWPAAQVAGLSRPEFEAELLKRKIAIYRPTEDDLRRDMEAFRDIA